MSEFKITDGILVKYKGRKSEAVIPEGVTGIGKKAFECFQSIEKVLLPEGLISIGDDAFSGCKNLRSVRLPDSLTSIGNYAFSGCDNLKDIHLPDSVTDIGSGAFRGCKGLSDENGFVILQGILFDYNGTAETVNIPSGVTEIGDLAFYHNKTPKRITIPEGVRSIGESAFYFCSFLEEIKLPDSLESIGESAFCHCLILQKIDIPEKTKKIGKAAFTDCNSLTEVILPDGLEKIEKNLFQDCFKLTRVVIPDTVTSIGDFAFQNCSSLANINVTDHVTELGYNAFIRCISLADKNRFVIVRNILFAYYGRKKALVIPEGTKVIDSYIFNFWNIHSITFPESLTDIRWRKDEQWWCQQLEKIIIRSSSVKIPAGRLVFPPEQFYISAPVLSNIAPEYRKYAAAGFAEENGDCATKRGKEHIKYIKANAEKLLKVAMLHPALLHMMCHEKCIPAKLLEKYMSAAQERGSAELIAMMLEYGNTGVSEKDKERAENQRERNEDAVINRMAERHGKEGISGMTFAAAGSMQRFSSRKELKKYIEEKGGLLAASVTSKVDYLIIADGETDSDNKRKAEELGIEILSEQEFIAKGGPFFFVSDRKLTKYLSEEQTDITVPEGVTDIGDHAFTWCRNTTHIVIPEGVDRIGKKAFYDCISLEEITLPKSITYIGDWAFGGCKSLKSVIIPDGVTDIGNHVFSTCTALKTITLPDSLKIIGDYAFADCHELTSVILPEGVTKTGNGAFSDCYSLKDIHIPTSVISLGRETFAFHHKELTIYAPAKSYAKKYALDHRIVFIEEI